mmetsp:Transcript_40742/g.128418  ORF Transcript_40742/g.128418 Transcript_40742/m.128418 type:complete len:129 (-) Transcript_40742:91-477(-)
MKRWMKQLRGHVGGCESWVINESMSHGSSEGRRRERGTGQEDSMSEGQEEIFFNRFSAYDRSFYPEKYPTPRFAGFMQTFEIALSGRRQQAVISRHGERGGEASRTQLCASSGRLEGDIKGRHGEARG